MSTPSIRQRLWIFRVAVVIAFVALTARLWQIQIYQGARYQQSSRDNRILVESVDAPRGVIYDRQGRILVRNRPSFKATLVPQTVIDDSLYLSWTEAQWAQAATTLRGIAEAFSMPFPAGDPATLLRTTFSEEATGQRTAREIDELCQSNELLLCYAEGLILAPHRPISLQVNLAPEVAFTVMERSISLPGLAIVHDSQREYLYGPLYGHLIGYELPISQELLDRQTRFTTNRYEQDDWVGVSGVEGGFEEEMRGVKGLQVVERNVVGERVRVTEERAPQPGNNLFLTLDTALQQEATAALQEGLDGVGSKEGVVIALNPNTGEILTMVTLPSYDNNAFVGTIRPEVLQALNEDPLKPMLNRAISGVYPAGSIFKLVPAAGALADGVITRETTINDPGRIRLPNENVVDNPALAMRLGRDFVCWLSRGHGDETVVDALAHSCDVFFYVTAGGYLDQFRGLGIAALDKWATAFGLGEATRIRLPGEVRGLVPNPRWKRLATQQSWVTGDTYNMAIGQGDLLVTPLQMLNVTAAVANGGTIYEPQVVYQVQNAAGEVVRSFEPRVLRTVPIGEEIFDIVREGMLGASTWEDGTANLVFRDFPVPVAGKTGTAEYCPVIQLEDGTYDCKFDANGNQLTHAWFTAFAPFDNPEIAIIVFVHGNNESVIQGSEIAAPIARRILDFYFTQRPLTPSGPVAPIPTPERAATATPLPFATWTPLPGEPTQPPVPTQPPAAPPAGQPTQPPAAPPTQPPAPTQAPVPTQPPPPPTQAPAPTQPPPPPPTQPPATGSGRYSGSLIGTSGQPGAMSVVSGRVLDFRGSPVAGVTITLDGGGATVATLTTASDGSFFYDLLNFEQSPTWYVRAPGLGGSPFVTLNIQPQSQYTVLFQEIP